MITKEFAIKKRNGDVLYYETNDEMLSAVMSEVGIDNVQECGRSKYIVPQETTEGE